MRDNFLLNLEICHWHPFHLAPVAIVTHPGDDCLQEPFMFHRWPSEEAFQQWDTPKYPPWRKLRRKACDITVTLVLS